MSAVVGSAPGRRIALQFGQLTHFNEGLGEFSRQLGSHLAARAPQLQSERGWRFSFILPAALHGYFGDAVDYVHLDSSHRRAHQTDPAFDVWHGLHQHMRFRPPRNAACRLVTVHDLNHRYAKQGLSLWWQERRLRRQVGGVERLVAISEHVREDIAKWWPWAPPVSVIHNGVADLASVAQEAVPELVGQCYFFHISRMSPSKNVGALIRMAAIWPERLFVFSGPDSPEVARHREEVAVLNLSNVRFICDVSEAQKAWLYKHCDAFLFPSLMEGFGLPPIEAMHFGVPVVVSRLSCLPEICGDAASYWDDFEPVTMKRVVERALSLEPSCVERRLSRAALYGWSRCAQQYLDLYDACPLVAR